MAEKIKGITIEFKGDVSNLQKSIREANKSIATTTKELTQVNKALKFNPTSVELWKQKQELLNQKVKDTATKLGALKKEQEQMKAAGVDATSAEYRALERQIIETTSQLKTFKGQLDAIGSAKLQALSAQFKQVGEKMEQVGKGLTKNVTAPIVAVGAASVKAFNEVKDGLNIVASKTGATGKELEEMQTTARNLAKTIPASFEEAGTAVGELNTRFGVTGQKLEDLGAQYLKFAKVNGVDLNSSIDETQKALAAFGKGADEAPELLDVLTKASQKTGASVDTLTKGLVQNAAAFQELGLDLNQSTLAMAQMEKSGANSETVMQGLRKALKNAAKDGKPLNQALSELQDTIKNGNGSMDGLTAAYDLFGKSGDQIYAAVKNGTLDFEALAAAAEDAGGTLDAVFEETLTPAEKFQTTLNSVKDAGYQIGGTLMQVLEPALKVVAEKMQAISEWWGKLSPESQQMIAKIALVAAAIGPVVFVIGKVITLVGTIMSILPMLGTAMTVLTGPIGLVVAAVAAVIAIGVTLFKHWDQVKVAAARVGSALRETFERARTAVSNAIEGLKNFVISAWEGLRNAVSNTANAIFDIMTWPFRKAWDTITGIIDWIKNLFPINIGDFFGKIKLPHIDWDWIDIGDFISIPKFSIDWYDKGGIFTSPSIIGVGERRPEFVGALDDLRQIVREEAGTREGVTINVYASPGMNEEELARKVEQKLVAWERQRAMAYGNI